MSDEIPSPPSICPECGREFTCGVAAGLSTCWCMAQPAGLAVPASGGSCYCPDCLTRKRQEAQPQPR